jgi:hypothetical protein
MGCEFTLMVVLLRGRRTRCFGLVPALLILFAMGVNVFSFAAFAAKDGTEKRRRRPMDLVGTPREQLMTLLDVRQKKIESFSSFSIPPRDPGYCPVRLTDLQMIVDRWKEIVVALPPLRKYPELRDEAPPSDWYYWQDIGRAHRRSVEVMNIADDRAAETRAKHRLYTINRLDAAGELLLTAIDGIARTINSDSAEETCDIPLKTLVLDVAEAWRGFNAAHTGFIDHLGVWRSFADDAFMKRLKLGFESKGMFESRKTAERLISNMSRVEEIWMSATELESLSKIKLTAVRGRRKQEDRVSLAQLRRAYAQRMRGAFRFLQVTALTQVDSARRELTPYRYDVMHHEPNFLAFDAYIETHLDHAEHILHFADYWAERARWLLRSVNLPISYSKAKERGKRRHILNDSWRRTQKDYLQQLRYAP